MSFRKLVAAVTFLAVVAMTARVTIDSDTFWHLAAGRWILEHAQILRSDPFSLSRFGQAWVYPGWLAQISLYKIFDLLGYPGLNLFTMLVVVLTFYLQWRAMDQSPLTRAFVVILAAAASGIFWSARPQMLTLLFTSTFVVTLDRHKIKGSSVSFWLLPLLMAVWANSHGGFIAGFLVLAAFVGGELTEWLLAGLLAGREWRQQWANHKLVLRNLGLLFLLLTLAVAINPFGFDMLGYPFKTVSIETLSNYIQEWQSPNFHMQATWPFLAMLLLVPLAMIFSKEERRGSDLLLYLGFAALALHSARNIALFAVGSSLVFSRHLDSAIRPIAEAIGAGRQVPAALARWLNLIAVLLLAIAVALWGWPRIGQVATQAEIERQFPVEATDYLLELSDPGPVFHTYRWGGYLIWQGTPILKSFVDGRTDLFGDELLQEYLLILQAGRGFQSSLDQWEFEYILIEAEAPLALAAERLGWPLLLKSDNSILFAVP